jgi:hypothetical protein
VLVSCEKLYVLTCRGGFVPGKCQIFLIKVKKSSNYRDEMYFENFAKRVMETLVHKLSLYFCNNAGYHFRTDEQTSEIVLKKVYI